MFDFLGSLLSAKLGFVPGEQQHCSADCQLGESLRSKVTPHVLSITLHFLPPPRRTRRTTLIKQYHAFPGGPASPHFSCAPPRSSRRNMVCTAHLLVPRFSSHLADSNITTACPEFAPCCSEFGFCGSTEAVRLGASISQVR
jgi:hypothetical protein